MPSGYEWLFVIAVIVLLFGGTQLPKLARSLGEAKKEFEKGSTSTKSEASVTKTDDEA